MKYYLEIDVCELFVNKKKTLSLVCLISALLTSESFYKAIGKLLWSIQPKNYELKVSAVVEGFTLIDKLT